MIKIYILVKLITKIKYIKSKGNLFQIILYILSPKSNSLILNKNNFLNVLLKEYDNYIKNFKHFGKTLFTNDIDKLYNMADFLKSIIKAATNNPFQFLR